MHPNLAAPFFGRPCAILAHAWDRTPVVTGWSLGGLSPKDRGRLAAFVRADARRGDTGMQYGPQQWLRSAPAPVMPRHIEDRLFMPVDVMRGQTTMEGL